MNVTIVVLQMLILAGIGSLFIFRKYLFSYSSEKGKNLATKEDIQEITRKIESVKSVYSVDLERMKALLSESSHQKNAVWLTKKDACLKALNVANAVLSHYQYSNVPEGGIVPQKESIESIRACFNELACTCEDPDVIKQLKKIVLEPVSPDSIVDLRSAVRKELGFKNISIDIDRKHAFVGKINCDIDRS